MRIWQLTRVSMLCVSRDSPGTSSSEPLWYDDQLRISIAVVGSVDPLPSPLPNNQKGLSAVVQQTEPKWQSTEDFGLCAARVRIENRYTQQQKLRHSIADDRADDESNRDGLQHLTTEDTGLRKLTVTRTKKDRHKGTTVWNTRVTCTDRYVALVGTWRMKMQVYGWRGDTAGKWIYGI